MILILLGTIKIEFPRLLNEVDFLIESGFIKEEVIAQIGHTKYTKNNIKTIDFCSQDEIDMMIDKSSLVISHAGTGSALSVLQKNKKLILCPRYSYLKEHVDDHQVELAEVFEKNNWCKSYYNNSNLLQIINDTEKKDFMKFKSNSELFIRNLDKLINNYIK
jgi:UDP-N-acetylglucosamine transferase subunit ALG13